MVKNKTRQEAEGTMKAAVTITEDSKRVFLAYAKDANNWGGTPLLGEGGTADLSGVHGDGSDVFYREVRGNLTQLKRAGLIRTFETKEEFTDAGVAYAAELGITVRY